MSCECSIPLFFEIISVVISTQYFTVVVVNNLVLIIMVMFPFSVA